MSATVTPMAVPAARRRDRVLSWSLAGAVVLVLAVALVLLGLNNGRMQPVPTGLDAILALAVGLYAATGRVIAGRFPANAIGWLLGLVALSLAISLAGEQYALYGLATSPGAWPAAKLAGWFSQVMTVLTIFILFFVLLLFPDGRLPSRRWRPVRWAVLIVMAGAVASQLQAGTTVTGGFTDSLDRAHLSYPNPLGVFPRHGWFSGLLGVTFGLAVITGLLSVASVFVRRRGASAELRRQLAWLGYVGLMTIGWVAVLLVGIALDPHDNNSLGTLLWGIAVLTPLAGIPLACVVAILKYRLYEIDRLISRTVSYAIVTGLLVGVYAGLVLFLSHVLPLHGPAAVAGSTLAAAALFSPLRRRVQKVVDRRFNRSRYDADLMITAFAARLQDATDLDAVRADLAATVHGALEPAHLSLWLGRVER